MPEQARTRLARRAVVGAARTLFLEQGYAATTVDAVSKLADVPPATVYRLFGSKLGILEAMLDTSIAGDDEPVPVAARPQVAPLFDEPDPVALLAGFAGVTAAINERTNDVHRVLVSAAGSDPGAAELLAEIRGQRDRGQRQIVRALARRKELRPGLSVREAEDRVHTVMSPEVYRLFVGDRGWSADHYREWLGTALAQQLL